MEKVWNKLKNLFARKKTKRIISHSHNPCDEIALPEEFLGNLPTERIYEEDILNNRIADFNALRNPNYGNMTSGFTFTIGTGIYNAKVDTYTIKQYEKDDFKNLIQLLTLWLEDENLKSKVKEIANTFEGEEFSEEDIDKFILALSFEISDEKIRSKFEETHQYWKNIKR